MNSRSTTGRDPPLVALAQITDGPALRALMDGLSPFSIERELERSYARLWVVRLNPGSEAVGFLLGWLVADEAHLIDLMVARDQRGRGLGRALLSAFIGHARASEAKLALLEVRRSNLPAQRLYTEFGFELSGERAAYYGDGEDALLFRLSLG